MESLAFSGDSRTCFGHNGLLAASIGHCFATHFAADWPSHLEGRQGCCTVAGHVLYMAWSSPSASIDVAVVVARICTDNSDGESDLSEQICGGPGVHDRDGAAAEPML